jgi:hypothetical protein
LLARAGGIVGGAGTSGGAVQCDLFWADGRTSRAAAVSTSGGQQMAVLPCVMAAHALAGGGNVPPGARWPHEVIGADALLAEVRRAGFTVVDEV